MLTKAGAKLLDFGLGKAREQVMVSGQRETTVAGPLTGHGTILGTLQDMAPEQLEGKEADARSDLFALGSVLYEMVTGTKAFEGKSTANIMAAILEREPVPASTRNPTVSPMLDHVIGKCLAKSPDSRWQAAHDIMLELRWVAEAPATAVVPATALRRMRLAVWVAAISVIVTTLIMAAWLLRGSTAAPAGVEFTVFQILPPPGTVLGQLAVSPDGRSIAFIAAGADGSRQVYVRQRDSFTIRPLPGTEGAASPFWSPDSRFIGFSAQNKVKKIAVSGGPAQALCDAPGGGISAGTWSSDGTIVFSSNGPLRRVSAAGGEPTAITAVPAANDMYWWPSFLPDGRHFLFSIRSDRTAESGVYAGSLNSQVIKPVVKADLRALYAPPSHLMYIRGRTLLAQPFDVSRLEVTGDPVVIAAPVGYLWTGFDAAFSVSPTGVVAYESAEYPVAELAWFDRRGRRLGRVGDAADYLNPWLGEDGRQVAVERVNSNTGAHEIWKLDVARNGNASRLTLGGRHMPVLSGDGHRMIYVSVQAGHLDLWIKDLRQPEKEDVLLSTSANKFPTDWSLDGRFLVYETLDARTQRDLWVMPLFGDRQPHPLLQSEFNEEQGQLSPDGRWMVYISDETGRWEVYVRSFPMLGDKQQISTAGGTHPRWRRDGKEIFYLAADRTLMAVDLPGAATMEPATPRPLFPITIGASVLPINERSLYAPAADGQRFLVNVPLEGGGPQAVTVATRWPALLQRP